MFHFVIFLCFIFIIWLFFFVCQQQQEQDPTNLYIANLPPHFKESDLDNLLSKYGQVISTRILRDSMGISKGVGFARMENKDKCEQIITIFNGNTLSGCKEPLLVKFADGGNKKKNMYKNNENAKMWRDGTEVMAVAGYDPNALAQNGVAPQHMIPAALSGGFRTPYGQVNWFFFFLGVGVYNNFLLIVWLCTRCSVGSTVCNACSIASC